MQVNNYMAPQDVDKVMTYFKNSLTRYSIVITEVKFNLSPTLTKEVKATLKGMEFVLGFNEDSSEWYWKYGDSSFIKNYRLADIYVSDTARELTVNNLIKVDFCG